MMRIILRNIVLGTIASGLLVLSGSIPKEKVSFNALNSAESWQLQMSDPGTKDWQTHWFLDGELATIENSNEGMNFSAGPVNRDDAHHAVLWTKDSFQGDQAIVRIMENLGVKSAFESDGVLLTQQERTKDFSFDFTDCPDLAQTVAVACAAKGVHCTMTGLESLRIKETDRIMALQQELAKIGAKLEEKDSTWKLIPNQAGIVPENLIIDTYDDHRMAMAFAPLVMKYPLTLEEPDVVKKSYPRFWEDLRKAGIAAEISG